VIEVNALNTQALKCEDKKMVKNNPVICNVDLNIIKEQYNEVHNKVR
jgi:hypothetical protein